MITNISIKSSKFLIDKIGIDLKSSIQLIYDVFGMMIEVLFFWYIIVDVIKLFVFFSGELHFSATTFGQNMWDLWESWTIYLD